MKILVINGPNLNLLGFREIEHYGSKSYGDLLNMISEHAEKKHIEVEFYQSNHEGDLVDSIHRAYFEHFDGIVINPGAYTHTSIALLDALKAVKLPAVEVHISNVEERENFRQISYIRSACVKSIIGEGFAGYTMALDYLAESVKK